MNIIKITQNKKRFINLLLLADEQEDMIDRYLENGDMYVMLDNGVPLGECVVTDNVGGIYELKNLAVAPEYQKSGYGRALIRHILQSYNGRTLIVGTGESPATLGFYEKCGFTYSHRIKDFFTNNYDHPIVDGGVLLRDMVYLKKEFK